MRFSPAALHIPDGFLTPWISALGWALSFVMIAIAIRKTRSQLGERQAPVMGVLAAFVFAAQAINFPVFAGTTGHLLGGALAGILMGPWAGTLIMTAVIAVQGLFFQDGGVLVMGWNILNMGVFSVFTGYAAYQIMRRLMGSGLASLVAGGFVGGWLSVMVGAAATAVELAASGTAPLALTLPAMAMTHALIGMGEGVISSAALSFLYKAKPEVLKGRDTYPGRGLAAITLGGMLIALGLALVSPLAASGPDGLQSVASQQGFDVLVQEGLWTILPGYTVPAISNTVMTTVVAMVLGTLIVFLVGLITGWLAGRRTRTEA